MRKVAITGERQAALVDAPDPRPKENWALVKVLAAPMCTEYKAFVAGRQTAFLGHEAAGEVVEVAQPCRVKPGDRVVVMPQYPCGRCELCVAGEYIHCQHTVDFEAFTGSPEGRATYAQYVLKPDWLLPVIPADVSIQHASLACCALGPTFGAMQIMGVGAFHTVLITGLGPVGLGGVVNARFRGARVIAVDGEPFRVERAKALGVAAVLDPADDNAADAIPELTDGKGVDRAVDCSGAPAAHRLCIEATRRKGQVAFVGECGDETSIRVSPDLIRTGIQLIGAWHYNLRDVPKVLQVIQHSPLVPQLISHALPMSRVQEAFELCAAHQTAKVILDPWT